MNDITKYDVCRDNELVFTGNKNESKKVFDRLNNIYKYNDDKITMVEHNERSEYSPTYENYGKFENVYHNITCFDDLKGMYDSNNKYIVKSRWDFQRIIQTSPNNIEMNFLNLKDSTVVFINSGNSTKI